MDQSSSPKSDPMVFSLACKFHKNAGRCRISRVDIDFRPMIELAKACAAIFNAVDREDVVQRSAARDAWLLRATLMLTALPFDDPRLNASEIIQRLELTVNSIPSIRAPVAALRGIVDILLAGTPNPKRLRVLEMLNLESEDSSRVALVTNLCGSHTPGWPVDLNSLTDFGREQTALVRTRREVRDTCFSRIVVPGNPKFVPHDLLFDLLYGGRSSDVVVMCYAAERSYVPRPVDLPTDYLFPHANIQVMERAESEEISDDTKIDDWILESFWESVHAGHKELAPISDRDVSVRARFVLFADGSGAFLPEEGRVVEISDCFDEDAEFDVAEDRLPRKAVRHLEEGDLVMMRITGSGDYLDDVADGLMAGGGDGKLRQSALNWKAKLLSVIKRHGEGVVAKSLRESGVVVRSSNYLWSWAGDTVMAPHDLRTFRCLITTIAMLDPDMKNIDARAYADEKWGEMERVKSYHHRAGAEIRASLVTRVRILMSDRKRIDSVQSIELPGVEAGTMGLLRVSAIDAKSMRVPQSKLFQLEKIRNI